MDKNEKQHDSFQHKDMAKLTTVTGEVMTGGGQSTRSKSSREKAYVNKNKMESLFSGG